jgi:ech hydrogenase subunit A
LALAHHILIVSPIFFAFLVFINEKILMRSLTIFFTFILGFGSVVGFFGFDFPFSDSLPHSCHSMFIVIDFLLLIYFFIQGYIKKSFFVSSLAIIQTILYIAVVSLDAKLTSKDIVVDDLSSVMYLVINVVGGIIIVYALEYIKTEKFSDMKKRGFIALLFLFLSVMNFIVSTNSIEIFFMLFEFTTLFSYLLIRYRGDDVALQNALRALWMNQIGGVAILVALIFSITYYDTVYFDILVKNMQDIHLIPIALLAIAAFVKGASIPYERWLLGAMVAPTPVSAMLHSATMVKIAPYLILKIAPAMNGFISMSVTLLGSFVFFGASLIALGKDYFKEILGLSTIALLSLMMALGAIGTQEAMSAALVLIVFHAISKALLFLQAGILEKSFKLKYVSDIDGLINHSKLVTFFIIIGFASLTLPSFGVFISKFMAIEVLAKEITHNPLYAVSLTLIALGSVFLTLLYFKVVTKIFAKDATKSKEVKIPFIFFNTSFAFLVMLIVGVYVSIGEHLLEAIEILLPIILIAITPLLFNYIIFKKAHRVKEYHCGEKNEVELNMFYFDISQKSVKIIYTISIALMVILIVGVVL